MTGRMTIVENVLMVHGNAVGISTGIIFVVLVCAYSNFVRTLFWLAYRYLVTLVLVKTPAYDRFYLSLDWKSAALTSKVEKEVKRLKAKAKKTKQTRMAQKLNDEAELEMQEMMRKAEEAARAERKSIAQVDLSPDGQQDGEASQGQPATDMRPRPHTCFPPPPRPGTLIHAETEPPRGSKDLEAGGGVPVTRRRSQFLRPAMVSEGAQTSLSLLERARSKLSIKRTDSNE